MTALQVAVLQFDVIPIRSRLTVAKWFDLDFRRADAEHIEHAEIDFEFMSLPRCDCYVRRFSPFQFDLAAVNQSVRGMKRTAELAGPFESGGRCIVASNSNCCCISGFLVCRLKKQNWLVFIRFEFCWANSSG